MMQVIRTGRNPTMRWLDRVHRIGVADMHERLGNPKTKDNVEVIYTKSDCMAADIYTKCFTDKVKWEHVCSLINITSPDKLKDMIRASSERARTMFLADKRVAQAANASVHNEGADASHNSPPSTPRKKPRTSHIDSTPEKSNTKSKLRLASPSRPETPVKGGQTPAS